MKLQPQSVLGAAFGAARPVAGFKTNGVTLRERADIGCVLLTATLDIADIVGAASAAAGVGLPVAAGEFRTGEGRIALWLSPRSWLIHCRIEEEPTLAARVNSAFPDKRAHAVPFTDALCWFELFGVESHDCLTEGGFLSLERGGLPIGHAKRTLIAGVAAVVVHERETVWMVAVERSRARYFADWLSENSQLPPFKRLA